MLMPSTQLSSLQGTSGLAVAVVPSSSGVRLLCGPPPPGIISKALPELKLFSFASPKDVRPGSPVAGEMRWQHNWPNPLAKNPEGPPAADRRGRSTCPAAVCERSPSRPADGRRRDQLDGASLICTNQLEPHPYCQSRYGEALRVSAPQRSWHDRVTPRTTLKDGRRGAQWHGATSDDALPRFLAPPATVPSASMVLFWRTRTHALVQAQPRGQDLS
jgi:hypothetical protein